MSVSFDLINTELAMEALQNLIPQTLNTAGPAIQARSNNTLLNIAVNRMVEDEGEAGAATILWRLADVIANGAVPTAGNPFDLTRVHG